MSAASTTNLLPRPVTSRLVLVAVWTIFRLATPVKADDTSGPMPDLIAYTGQVFTTSFESHPIYGHPDARVRLSSQTDSRNTDLPAWLVFDDDRKSLAGVPLPRDQGTLSVTIRAECLPRDATNTPESCQEASSQFYLEVQPLSWAPLWAVTLNPAPSVLLKSPDVTGSTQMDEDGSQSCESSNELLASLVLCMDMTDTTSRERLELIRTLAGFLSVPVTSILLGSSSHSFLAVSHGFHMITAAGSGSEEVCPLAETSELVWILPCSTLSHLPDFTQVLQHNVEGGRLGKELGVRLDGWYIASSSSHFGRPRRRRAPGRKTIAFTPILTALGPETVSAGSDDYFPTTSFADTTRAVRHSFTSESDQLFSVDIESSRPIDSTTATQHLMTGEETSSKSFPPMSSIDYDAIPTTSQRTMSELVITSPARQQPSFRSATSLQSSPSLSLRQSSTDLVSLIATRVVQVVAILPDPSRQSTSALLQPSITDNVAPSDVATFLSTTSTTSALHSSYLLTFISSLGPGLKDDDNMHNSIKKLPYHESPLESQRDFATDYAWLNSEEKDSFVYKTSDVSISKTHILLNAVNDRLEVEESGNTREKLLESSRFSQDYSQQSLPLQTSTFHYESRHFLDDATYITTNTEYLDTSTTDSWRATGDFFADTTDLTYVIEHGVTARHFLATATEDVMTVTDKITASTESVLTLLEDLTTLIEGETTATETTITVSDSFFAGTEDLFTPTEDLLSSPSELTTLIEDQTKSIETTTIISESVMAATEDLFTSTDNLTPVKEIQINHTEITTEMSDILIAASNELFTSADEVTTFIDDHITPTQTTMTVSEGLVTAMESLFTLKEDPKSLPWGLLASTDVITVAANITDSLSAIVTSDLLLLFTSKTFASSSVDVTSYSATSSVSFFVYDETTTTSSVEETIPPHRNESIGINRSPSVHHSLGVIIGQQGSLVMVSIPRRMFVDPEDGDTRSLSLSLEWPSRQEISGNFWFSIDKERQMLTGLPLPRDGRPGNLTVWLTARDSGGLTATAPLIVHVEESDHSSYTHEFVMIFASNFHDYSENRRQLINLVHRIGDYFGQDETRFIRVLDMKPGSLVLSWTNTSLSGTVCPQEAVQHVMDHMTRKDGSVKTSFQRHLGVSAPLTGISLQPLGACYTAPDTTTLLVTNTHPVTDTGQYVVQGVNVWAHVITPVTVAFFVFLFIILLIVFCNRRRRRRRQSGLNMEKEAVSNDRNPIIYPDDLDIDDSSPKPRQPRPSRSGSLPFEQVTVPSTRTGVKDALLTTDKSENASTARRPSYISVTAENPSDIIVTERIPSDTSVTSIHSSNVSVARRKSSQGTSSNSHSASQRQPSVTPDRTKTPSDIHRNSQSPVDIPVTPKTPLDIPSSTISRNLQAEDQCDSRQTEQDPGTGKASPLDHKSDLSLGTPTDPLRSSDTSASLETPAPETADSGGPAGAEDETETGSSASTEGSQRSPSRHSLAHPPLYRLPPPYVTSNNVTRV